MLMITGATGHTGQWLIKKLAAEGYKEKIRCSVQTTTNRTSLVESGLDIEYVVGDFRDPAFAIEALAGVSTLIHLMGISCSRNIVLGCKKNNVSWAILVHTTGRYSKFKSAAQEYIENEDWILSTGVPCTIVRPTMIYGSHRDRNMWKLIDFLNRFRVFPVFGSGNNLMQPIHAKDLGEALYAVLSHRQTTYQRQYNVAGKEPITYYELLKTIGEALHKKIFLVKVPYFFCYWGAVFLGLFSKSPIISVEQVMRMKEDKAFDYSDATRDFNFHPMSFAQGIKGEVESYFDFVSQTQL